MDIRFKTNELSDLYYKEIKGKQKFSKEVILQYKKKVRILLKINSIRELYDYKGLHCEKLKGDRKEERSIKLNDQYRLIFIPLKEDEIDILKITEISKHYG